MCDPSPVRYAGGVVPTPGEADDLDREIQAAVAQTAAQVDTAFRGFEFHRALEHIFALLDQLNRYLETRAPWKAAKQPGSDELVATTLYTCCEALRSVALLLAPFLPDAAPVILERLGIPDALASARLPDDAARWGLLEPGTPTQKGGPLFPRVELPKDDAAEPEN